MNTFLEMPLTAQVYILATAMLGAIAAVNGLSHWQTSQSLQFAAYLLVAVLASALKVNLPAITGTMSVNSFFLLICMVQLKQGETMIVGLVGVLIQCLWKPKTPVMPIRVAFSATANTIAIAASYFVLNQPFFSPNLESLRILATACAYFLVNTALVALVVSLTERKKLKDVWIACYFWCFPYYLGGAALAWISTLLSRYFGWQVSLSLLPVMYLIYRSYQVYLQRLEGDRTHVEEMAGLHLRTIEALALAIEAKDHTTHDHLRRVRVYALELGTRMGLSDVDLQSLRAAALLHDIGKLAVPEHIISKPGKLTPEEFEKMKIHPGVGAQILEQVQFPYPVAPIVLSHHEKWDGSGYPNGLKGEEIPLGARILTAVDALDALASDRQYRRAMPLDRAMEIVAAESGRTFDPAVIRLLQSCYVELERKAVQQPRDSVRLDTEPVALKGGAPATGFEQSISLSSQLEKGIAPANTQLDTDTEFLAVVAHARQAIEELHEWTRSADGSLTLAETLGVFAMRLQDLLTHDSIAFYVKRGNYLLPAFVGGQNRLLFSCLRIPYGEGLSGWVAENRRPLLNGNPSVEAGYLNDPQKFSTLRSALAAPLETANGLVGVLAFYRTERDAFSANDLQILVALSSRIAQSLEYAADRKPVAQDSNALTQLPSAGQLYLELAGMVRFQENSFALILCDLDNFGEINRRFGRDSADRVLQQMAHGLSQFFKSGEYIAHLGGDEFVVLIPGATAPELERHYDRIRLLVNSAGRHLPEPSLLSVSFGAALFPSNSSAPEVLLAEAEASLDRAKRANRVPPPAVLPLQLSKAATPAVH